MARMLRDWTDSEKIHKLSAQAERFFTRLIMKADDYGRYHADVRLLKAYLFPLHEKLKDETIESWLKECVGAGLIFVYDVNGKMYLEIKLFDQNLKVRRSKFPPSNNEDRIALSEGYVYLIGVDFSAPVKIGFSINPWSRLKEIATNHPGKLQILLTCKATKQVESKIHKCLKSCRVKNEWFQLSDDVIDLFTEFSKGEINSDTFLESLRNDTVDIRSNSYKLRSTPEDELEEEVEDELEEEKEERAGAHSPELIADFEKFKVWSQEHAPRVLKMKEPFSIDQFAKIKNDFSAAQISEILKAMHNWEPLLKKNRSAYLTAIKWLQKENNETNRRTTSGGNSTKPGTSEARMQAAKNWGRKEI